MASPRGEELRLRVAARLARPPVLLRSASGWQQRPRRGWAPQLRQPPPSHRGLLCCQLPLQPLAGRRLLGGVRGRSGQRFGVFRLVLLLLNASSHSFPNLLCEPSFWKMRAGAAGGLPRTCPTFMQDLDYPKGHGEFTEMREAGKQHHQICVFRKVTLDAGTRMSKAQSPDRKLWQ